MSLDQDVAELFPQLKRQVRGRRLVYLDSAATTLKPIPVIEAVRQSLMHETANVHRGAHFLSDEATEKFEGVREKLVKFLGAKSRNEVIFTKGTTDGLNLLARSLGSLLLNAGDEILLSQMEHHSNIVPWQLIAQEKGAKVRFAPVKEDGSLDFIGYKSMLSPRTKIVSLVHISNALGTINPIKEFFAEAKAAGAVTVTDAAQSAAVLPIDVIDLGADFAVFSGHKLFAPTGIGVLYGRAELLNKMPPYQGGGSMISEVREEGTTFLEAPHRFEAGTPAIAEVIGLGAAIDFVTSLDFENIAAHERELTAMTEEGLARIGGVRPVGVAPMHSHAVSFLVGKSHPSDVGAILDEQGVAVRAGHHCCQPLMRRFQIPGTVRASFSVYTSEVDIQDFLKAVTKAKELLV